MTHFELIRKYCVVLAETANAIFYEDDGMKYAEINGASFSCGSVDQFYDMVELFGDDTFEE